MPWIDALRTTTRTGLHLNRAYSSPKRALRAALAVALVAFPTLAIGGPRPATSAALGAFIAGVATFQRSFRPRPSLAVASAIGLGVSTFTGYLSVSVPGLFPVVLACWALLAGLAWAIGQTGGVVAATSVSVMLVVVQLPVGVSTALDHALLCAVGGVVQALLIALWPIEDWQAHRDALADAYAALADYARRLREDPTAPVDPEALIQARHASELTPWQDRHRPQELHGLRGLAESMRPALTALADPRAGVPEEGPARERVREVLAAAAELLDALASAIRHGHPLQLPGAALALVLPAQRSREAGGADGGAGTGSVGDAGTGTDIVATGNVGSAGAFPALLPALPPTALPALLPAAAADCARQLTVLLGRAADTLERCDHHSVGDAPRPSSGALPRPALFHALPRALHSVRRQLRPDSPVLRHAVRLAVVVTVAQLATGLLGLPRGYWAPMTAAMVIRPDFGQTFSRGVARLAGTSVGVAVATVLVELLHPNRWWAFGLAVACIGGAYLTLKTGYAMMTAFVSAYVVFLLGLQHGNPLVLALDRVGLTLLGGTVALLTFAAFPSWASTRLNDRLADWLESTGRYCAGVFAVFGDPRGADRRAVRDALLDARSARAGLLEGIKCAAAEPGWHCPENLTPRRLEKARAAVGLLGRVGVLLEAQLPERGAAPAPGAGEFAVALARATEAAADAVRAGRAPEFGALRAVHRAWTERDGAGDGDSAGPGGRSGGGAGPGDGTAGVLAGAGRLLDQALDDLELAFRREKVAAPTGPTPARAAGPAAAAAPVTAGTPTVSGTATPDGARPAVDTTAAAVA
ncbi:FUSC family protein [Kitasatospora sp. NPDC058965]|uniref:FUSC family protein n=1 Tax=Kitasatospora sp. NPDC058965 TaxID=3346682 RepID=UPI0036A43215